MVDILDFYTDLEGYVRIRVRFLENVIMKWQYGDQAHCYGYGEPRTWFYHFRIWQTSWNSQNLGLYPTKDWTDWTETWNHVQNFMQNQVVDFYVSSNTCGYALMKDNLTTDDWVNFSGVQGSYDSVWDDPSHYMWSGQKSY